MTKGFKVLSLKEELYDSLHREWEKQTSGKRVKLSFTSWVSEILWEALEKREASPARRAPSAP